MQRMLFEKSRRSGHTFRHLEKVCEDGKWSRHAFGHSERLCVDCKLTFSNLEKLFQDGRVN